MPMKVFRQTAELSRLHRGKLNGHVGNGFYRKAIDVHRIMEMILHRYPFLMIDRVVDIVPGVKATGVKNATINEPFCGPFSPTAGNARRADH